MPNIELSSADFKQWTAYLVAGMLLCITVVGGILGTKQLTEFGENQVSDESEAFVKTLSAYLTGEMNVTRKAVRAMAGSPWVAPALLDGTPENLGPANSVLDRYNEALNSSVCYLMNESGVTNASSNRFA